ncbi:MAG: hypothetical protein TV41_06420 [Wolbachia endosymbiont of Dactylopius coccus]|nr:MAG: hypothetical protein TV41_06420 [Wolbachia endosymbiont of Dactylopius coccus]
MSILFELSRFGRNDEYKGSKMLRYKGGLSPLIDEAVRKRKKQVGSSWRDLYQLQLLTEQIRHITNLLKVY